MKTLNLKSILAIAIISTCFHAAGYSQWKPKTLNVALVSESISIPFVQFVPTAAHPGFAIGTDLWTMDKTSWHQSFGIEAGYFYHRTFEHAVMLDAVYNLGYTFSFKLRPNFIAAVGYKHSILSGNTFVLEDGVYVKKTHLGVPQVNFKIGFGLEYPITDKYRITANYIGSVPVPGINGNPFSLHTLIQIGTKIDLQSN